MVFTRSAENTVSTGLGVPTGCMASKARLWVRLAVQKGLLARVFTEYTASARCMECMGRPLVEGADMEFMEKI